MCTDKLKAEAAEEAAEAIAKEVVRLHAAGLPIDAVLAGGHAQIVSQMAAIMGGEVAAEACLNAAARVRDIPSALAVQLAAAKPEGNA